MDIFQQAVNVDDLSVLNAFEAEARLNMQLDLTLTRPGTPWQLN